MSFLSRVQSKLVQLKGFTDESLGTKLAVTGNHRGIGSQTFNRWAIFVIFSKKLPIKRHSDQISLIFRAM